MHDLVIRGGTVVDGSGLVGYRADVGIQDGRIVEIGRIRGAARKELDAEGHVVAPGFIDGHTHMDAQVFWDPLGTSSSLHGVTTVVMGNCGFTLAPCAPTARELVLRNLERAEDIPAQAMAQGIDWTWETFAQYLDAVERAPKAINYASNLGHSALRTWAMGERAFDGPSTEDDIRRMEHELEAGLAAGAMGFTTSRSSTHETSDDRPVASRQATWDEVRRLVDVMARTGRGQFELACESVIYDAEDPAVQQEFADRLKALAVASGVPVSFGTVPVRQFGLEQLGLLDATAAEGGRMFGQCSCRSTSFILSFRSFLPFDRLLEWQEVRARPVAEQVALLRDPEVRRRLVHAAHHGDYRRVAGAGGKPAYLDRLVILDSMSRPNRRLSEVAAERGMDPVELMIDLAVETDLWQLFHQETNRTDEDELLAFLRHPRTVMTLSDSGAHVGQIIDASIQTHLFQRWVRDRQEVTLEEAVRMVTLEPARAFGFADRGLVREGLAADLNVFDPATIGPDLPAVVTDLPGGATRLCQGSVGIQATIVGGEVTLEHGRPTGALPGRLLRRRRHGDTGSSV